MRHIPRLHVITDEVLQTRYDHATLARLAFAGGADAVQIREKRPRPARELIAIAEAARSDGHVIVDDRADVAFAAGVGVHVGAEDVPPAVARRIVGPDVLVGFSTRTVDGVRAVPPGVDYVGVGPVYGTRSKPGLTTPLGLERLAAIVAASPVPVIAIGGITADRVAEVIAAGVHGVAAISAIVCAADPAEEAARFAAAIAAARS